MSEGVNSSEVSTSSGCLCSFQAGKSMAACFRVLDTCCAILMFIFHNRSQLSSDELCLPKPNQGPLTFSVKINSVGII